MVIASYLLMRLWNKASKHDVTVQAASLCRS